MSGLSLQLPGEPELLAQGMHGGTLMGPNARARALCIVVSAGQPRGRAGRATVRYDWFKTTDRDIMPLPDPNGESGHAWALAYSLPLPHSLKLVAERCAWTAAASSRPDRRGAAPEGKQRVDGAALGVLTRRAAFRTSSPRDRPLRATPAAPPARRWLPHPQVRRHRAEPRHALEFRRRSCPPCRICASIWKAIRWPSG